LACDKIIQDFILTIMKKILLIDSNALIYRSYHALPPLKKDGKLVNAAYGFFSILSKVLDDEKPDYVAAAFDRKEKTFRHDIFEDYKAQRPEMPEDLVSQLPIIKRGLESFGIPIFEEKGYEADDIIATLAEKLKDEKEVVVLSGDRDLLQLVDKKVTVRSPGRGIKKMINFDKDKVVEKYGVSPELFVDYKALRGDPSDNIPGIEGIGKKRAKDLVSKHGTIEEIYANLDNLKEAQRRRLEGKEKEALLSKKLVTLKRDMDIDVDSEECQLRPGKEKVEFFEELNFKTLAARYRKKEDSQMKLEL